MESETIKFKPTFPRKLANLLHQNQVLKFLAVTANFICLVSLLLTILLIEKGPVVIPLGGDGSVVPVLAGDSWTTLQVESAIKKYIGLRYSWEPNNIGERLNATKVFIPSGSRSSFQSMADTLSKFSKEKVVFQRVYPTNIQVDLKTMTAQIVADRFNIIQGLKAASTLKVKLYFEPGTQTSENPWGLYISKEEEEGQQ